MTKDGLVSICWKPSVLERQPTISLYQRKRTGSVPRSPWCPWKAGVPVAAWESGGLAEWHPGDGLCAWGDLDALAAAIRRLAGTRAAPPSGFEAGPLIERWVRLYGQIS